MKRRNFIKKSLIATASLTSISSILNAQDETMIYNGIQFIGTTKDGKKTSFETYKELLLNYDDPRIEDDKRVLKFKVQEFASDGYTVASEADYRYKITKFEKLTDTTYNIKAKLDEKINYDVRPEFLENKVEVLLNLSENEYLSSLATITFESEKYEMKTVPKTSDYDYSGSPCFLTTACTLSMGKADDCYELTTLRNFRDTYMKKSDEGAQLIEDYYQDGPRIVAALNASANPQKLYTHLYDGLVIPSLSLIESGELEAAMNHYHSYVLELNKIIEA